MPKVEDWAAVDRLLASLTTEAMNIYHVTGPKGFPRPPCPPACPSFTKP